MGVVVHGEWIEREAYSTIITEVFDEATIFDVEAPAATVEEEVIEEELGTKGDEPEAMYILFICFCLVWMLRNYILYSKLWQVCSFILSSHCKRLIEGLPPKNKIS